MNEGITKLARADMRRAGFKTGKIPRAAKKLWASLSHRERGKLSASWKRK